MLTLRLVAPRGRAARWLSDLTIAVVVTLVNLATASRFFGGLRGAGAVLLWAALVTWFVAVLLRHRHPLGALQATVAAALVVATIGVPLVVATLTPLVVVHAAAAGARADRAWVVLPVAGAATVAVEGLAGFPHDPSTVAGNLAALGVAWLLGTMSASRQRYVDALEQRTAELEAARTELAERAVAQERLRIARELHDVVAHALSVVTVRAGVAAHVAADQPEEAVRALTAIESAGRTAMADMRRMVGLLRDRPGEVDGTPPLAPQPGIGQLPDLVAGLADAGPAITLDVDVAPDDVDDSVGLAVHRIVQESLTNALRHAGASTIRITVHRTGTDVAVEVRDDGGGGPTVGAGHGLRGIRERVAAHGGSVTAGPAGDRGFVVRARMPARSPADPRDPAGVPA